MNHFDIGARGGGGEGGELYCRMQDNTVSKMKMCVTREISNKYLSPKNMFS